MFSVFLPRRGVIVERQANRLPDLGSALAASLAALTESGLADGPWLIGEPPGDPILTTEIVLTGWLEEVAAARQTGVPEVAALTASGLLVVVDTAPDGTGTLSFSLPTPEPPLETVTTVVRAVAESFRAYHAHVSDDRLLLRYQSQRATARAKAALPQALQQYVPEPIATAGDLPELLLPDEFDRRRVPTGVWWVNYWDAVQVATVGLERVLAAGWARVIDAGDGAQVLAATTEPLDPERPDHLTQLKTLLVRLRLAELQLQFRA